MISKWKKSETLAMNNLAMKELAMDDLAINELLKKSGGIHRSYGYRKVLYCVDGSIIFDSVALND